MERFQVNGLWGLKDDNGNVIVPPKYDELYDIGGNRLLAVLNKKVGFLDTNGGEITPIKYETIELFEGKYSKVSIENKYGVIDKQTGKEVIPCEYDSIPYLSEFLAVVRKDGKEAAIKLV